MLILKLTDKYRQTHDGFQWPESGPVECPDWNPRPECGGGLHGWAKGGGNYVHDFNEGQWLVVEAADEDVVMLDGGAKCKFRKGTVVFCGRRADAVGYLVRHGALTAASDPALVCLTMSQLVEYAESCSERAQKYAANADAANAYYAAHHAANAAASAARAAAAAASAANADAAHYAYYAAADAADADASKAEREAQRQDKLRILGITT